MLYFVRHGESVANVQRVITNRGDGFGLTAKGQQQAQTLAEDLRGVPVAALYASPLRRARETAAVLGQHFNLAVQITDALREFDCGVLEGQADEESWRLLVAQFGAWADPENWAQKLTGGESFLEIRARFVPLVEQLISAHPTEQIVLVGHGGLFMLMLPLVLSNVTATFARAQGIGNTECIVAEREATGLVCRQWGPIKFS